MAGAVFEFVTVIVDGYELPGWQEVDVRHSMQQGEVSFMLKATHANWSPATKRLRKGENIEVYTTPLTGNGGRTPGSGDLMCTGAIDNYEADIGEGANKTITLHGRSHARDVIDCPPVDHPTGRSENKTLLGHAKELGAEFDVPWSSDIDLQTIAKVQWRPGEKLFETIERAARAEGVMLMATREGGINITRAGAHRHAGALVEGQPPVNRIAVRLQPANEPSEVVVRGQRALGTGQDNLRQEQRYKRANAGSRRHRPKMVILEGDRGANRLHTRGKWHHLRSFGHGNIVAPRISRWRDENNTLWTPGWLMAIKVPSEDIDMDMTLSEANFRQGLGKDGGTRAELVFVDPRSHGGDAPMGTDDPEFDPGAELDGGDEAPANG